MRDIVANNIIIQIDKHMFANTAIEDPKRLDGRNLWSMKCVDSCELQKHEGKEEQPLHF